MAILDRNLKIAREKTISEEKSILPKGNYFLLPIAKLKENLWLLHNQKDRDELISFVQPVREGNEYVLFTRGSRPEDILKNKKDTIERTRAFYQFLRESF